MTDSSHAHYDSLCGLAAAGLTSAQEDLLLAEHLNTCSECQHALRQYRQVSAQMVEEALAERDKQDEEDVTAAESNELFLSIRERIAEPREAVETLGPEHHGRSKRFEWIPTLRWPRPFPASIAFASLIVGAVLSCLGLLALKKTLGKQNAESARLQRTIDQLRDDLDRANNYNRNIESPSTPAAVPNEASLKLQRQAEELSRRLQETEAARRDESGSNAQLREQVNLLSTSLEVLKASNANLGSDKANLNEQLGKLNDALQASHQQNQELDARNLSLATQERATEYLLEQQKHLNETDQAIREVLSSRSLHIQNVYDVSTEGEFERPYGRVFYTEGKSLVFYAFDLNKQKGFKQGAVFQAWGQRASRKDQPRSLGAFYVDDAAQNRWVLRVSDGNVLSHIDYIFVTVNSPKEDLKPKGREILSAFLTSPPDQPSEGR